MDSYEAFCVNREYWAWRKRDLMTKIYDEQFSDIKEEYRRRNRERMRRKRNG